MTVSPNLFLDFPGPTNLIGDGPEGPEVKTVADCLDRFLAGKTLVKIGYGPKSKNYPEGPDGINKLPFPSTIKRVWCKGKHIFFDLMVWDSFYEEEEYWILHSHLGMTGHWVLEKEKHSHTCLVVQSGDSKTRELIYYGDYWRGGYLEVLTPAGLEKKLQEIGPDLLSEEISDERWLGICQSRIVAPGRKRISDVSDRLVADFLLEQKYFSGIGNYVRAEALWRAKISPYRKMGSLTEEELLDLFDASRAVLKESYDSRGLTIYTYWDLNGQRGEFKVQVYEKETDPDGNPVVVEKIGTRNIHWVPDVQN